MTNTLILQSPLREEWLCKLTSVITNRAELLEFLELRDHPELIIQHDVKDGFPLRVPRSFALRMCKGDPKDPLLLQVLTLSQELVNVVGYKLDPLNEKSSTFFGVLHKYHNRALFLVKGHCAIHCRYCFRRHFPYQEHKGNKQTWQKAIEYIKKQGHLDEIILSGGDPLIATDHELDWLFSQFEKISHLKRLRIHSRLLVVIPQRITQALCQRFKASRLQVLIVTHINHMKEINEDLRDRICMLKCADVTVLNQSVLLRHINDNAVTLAELSNALFDAGILPYYLHILDKVHGAAHFYVSDDHARLIFRDFITMVSGYLVPKLVREIPGERSKTSIDLYMSPDKNNTHIE
ncbi:EF-P beta-lysylation protein EpmB [Candidatus Erwinia haradaeae]|uniref:L-lysine 2,3-aminomutase n=1 Tax=Candidatus Erwinia haradaeae TaxID=1922217 RepID=A0A451DA71_9GAMM|nr:EF-P beta-lysylation protein EpmB [Candidatus Erwinia haradaeae]VFP83159.1 L-lysine 2,3-aminomutase [Candidatus Erwinia haradaeae]